MWLTRNSRTKSTMMDLHKKGTLALRFTFSHGTVYQALSPVVEREKHLQTLNFTLQHTTRRPINTIITTRKSDLCG
jgi:hypothetical protein